MLTYADACCRMQERLCRESDLSRVYEALNVCVYEELTYADVCRSGCAARAT